MTTQTGQKGSLMLEALIVILILAVNFVVFAGVVSRASHVSARSFWTLEAVSEAESALFDLDTGVRSDLVSYGGKSEKNGAWQYEIRSENEGEYISFLKGRIFKEKPLFRLEFEASALRMPVE